MRLTCAAILLSCLFSGGCAWPNSRPLPAPQAKGPTQPTPPRPPDDPAPRVLAVPGESPGEVPGAPSDPSAPRIGRVYDWLAWAALDDRANRGFPKRTVEEGHLGVLLDRLPLLRAQRPDGSLWSHPHGNPHIKGQPMRFNMLEDISREPRLRLLADLDEFRRAVALHVAEIGEPPVVYTGAIRLNPDITLAQVERYGRQLYDCGVRRIVIDASGVAPPNSVDWDAISLLQKSVGLSVGCEPWPSHGLPSANLDVWVLDVPGLERRSKPGKVEFPTGEIVNMHMTFDEARAVEQLARGESVAINLRALERQGLTVAGLKAAAERLARARQAGR